MTDKIKTLAFPNPDVHRLVVELSQAHSGPAGLTIPREEEDVTITSTPYTVAPRALAAALRFADEVSETHTRVSRAILPNVPEDKRIYWDFACCVSASRPEPSRNRVVITITLQDAEATKRYALPNKLQDRFSRRKWIALIEYILCRLEKMNNERAYCRPSLSRYARIDEIECRLSILRDHKHLPQYEETLRLTDSGLGPARFPNTKIVEDFFNSHPHWKPASIKRGLR